MAIELEAGQSQVLQVQQNREAKGVPEFVDIGFDTQKQSWFLQTWNTDGQFGGIVYAAKVILEGGNAVQRQWKDAEGRPLWHVRETFFVSDLEKVENDVLTGTLIVKFKKSATRTSKEIEVPEYDHIEYGYHLTTNERGVAPKGFIDFCDAERKPLHRLDNMWLVIEGVPRQTIGAYPRIRLSASRKDIEKIVVTSTCCTVVGK